MSKPLTLRAELGRQRVRRRTRWSFAFLALLPLILVVAFALGSGDERGDGAPDFVDLAQVGAANFTVFTLFSSTGFLLVVLVSLFVGDSVPSEASWSTLRYLLAAPVPRDRLLRTKLVVGLLSSLTAIVFLVAWSLAVGAVFYGIDGYQSFTGERLSWAEFGVRLAVIVAYLCVSLLFVAAVAFLAGVLTDAPLAAVGSAVVATIVSSILDSITALGELRQALPTHEQFAWAETLQGEIVWSGMASGALWSVLYASVLLSAAFVAFSRKDVLS